MAWYTVECSQCGNEKAAESVLFLIAFIERCEFCGDEYCPNCESLHEKCEEEADLEESEVE